jgi:hypothetical protein
MRPVSWKLALVVPSALAVVSCDSRAKEELGKRLNEANEKLVECRRETNDLQNQVTGLKRQLAQAVANPANIVLTDPEIINLIADIRGRSGDDDLLGAGALDPKAASKIVMNGARALQQCYERALKKNQTLQYQAGVGMTLGVTVRPQGTVQSVQVSPSIDPEMTSCMKTAAMRWKFPTFAGEPVTIEQKITLTPTKS